METLRTPEQVADLLGKSPWWVANEARSGRLVGHKVGRSWRFFDRDVEAYLNRGSAPDPASAIKRRRAS